MLALIAGCGRIGFDVLATPIADAPGADAAADALMITGLIHYWPVDEAPGANTARDMIGAANAMVIAPAAFVAGHRGNALASTSGGYATVAIPDDLLGKSQLTINGWFQRATPMGIEQVGQEVSGAQNISIQFWNDGLVYFCAGQGGSTACGTTASADTSWHMATYVFDGTQPTDATRMRGYLDGVPQTLAFMSPIPAVTPPQTGGTFDLGAVTDNEGSDTGTVDEVTIYDRALTDAEIQILLAR